MTDLELAKKLLNEHGWKPDTCSDTYRKDNKIIDGITLIIDPTECMEFAGLKALFDYQKYAIQNGSSWQDEFYITAPVFKDTACRHEWVKYTGLNETYEFCKLCDDKKS